jgi:hypothetical protein
MALLANVNTSFKISSARELMGTISQDRTTAITGTLGTRAQMIPLDIAVTRNSKSIDGYHMRIVNDPSLSPSLMQMALFSAIDATERSQGASSVLVNGSITFENRKDPVELRNIFAGDAGSAMQAATSTAVPLAYLMQGGFDNLKVKSISLKLDSFETKKDVAIAQVFLSRKEVRPGETIELMVQLDGENGADLSRTVKYQIPPGTSPGTLFFTVADGPQTSILELRQIAGETAHSPDQLISMVNRLRPSDKAYIRVWRPQPAYEVAGEELPDPPPSLSLVLGSTQGLTQNKNSKIAEIILDAGEFMVTGAKTVQLEVKQ